MMVNGYRVRELRSAQSLSRAQLAEKVRATGTYLSKAQVREIEAGRAGDIRSSKAVAIARALDATVEDIVSEEPEDGGESSGSGKR